MKIFEIGTGYTSIPADKGAATEVVIEELTKSFRKMNIDVQIVDIADKNRLETDLDIIEVKLPEFLSSTDTGLGIMHKVKRVIYSIALAKKLKQIIKSTNDISVLHFHNQYNLFFFLKLTSKSLRRKIKIAYTVHSYIWPAEWKKIESTVKKKYFQEVYCVRNADDVFVLNEKTADNFIEHLGVDEKRIHKVINGVNTDVYSILSDIEIESIKCELGLEEKNIILQVGSVCDRKNQLGAVEMLTEYLHTNKNVVYLYVGGIIDEGYKAEIDRYAADKHIESQVIYGGEISPGKQLNKYYNAASLMIFPSKREAFGLVIIEALSAGTPVILSDGEIVKNTYGFFGVDRSEYVYETKAECLALVEKNISGQKKGEKNRLPIMKQYSWDTAAEQYMSNFKEE